MTRETQDIFDMIADVMISRRAEWRDRAKCKGGGVDTFFPPSNIPSEFAKAKAMCAECPVTAECKEEWESMPTPMRNHGVWFGTNDGDRRGRRKR